MASEPISPIRPYLLPALALFLFSLILWSCNTGNSDDVYSVTFKLDSARVGKFDSVEVRIYNGKAPAPGDTIQPAQVEIVKLTPATKEITVQLNGKVKKDFSVIITGYSGKEITYRNEHSVQGFAAPDSSKPPILLISRIQAEDLTLSVGETRAPALTFSPENAGDKHFTLATKDSLIVKVAGDSLTGLKAGKAKVFASSPDGVVSIDFAVNVADVRVASLHGDSLSLKVGDTLAPAITVLPANATDREYSLASSDSGIVKVAGKSLHALQAGSVSIAVKSRDGGAKDSFAVFVRVPAAGLAGNDLIKGVGDVFVPVLVWKPANATLQGYTLASKDTNTVAVRGDSLEAKSIGAVKITATSKDGGFAADFQVNVQAKVFRVKAITAADLRGLLGDTLDADISWDPANASDKGFTLKVADTAVATVADGKLVPKANGKTQVEVSANDGGKKATFVLTVEPSNFKADILPITSSKCAPCHVPPGATFNWTDSAQLVRKGAIAVDRLTRPDTAAGKMPVAGATGGPLGKRDLNVLLGWLTRVAIPVTGMAMKDTVVNLGDTLAPNVVFTPANAANRAYTLSIADSSVVVLRGNALVTQNVGATNIDITSDEGGFHTKVKIQVDNPLFQKNVLPITSVKCFPCHGPGTTFNWQDSVSLISDGSNALDRLQRDINAAGRMPLKVGAPNGDLTAAELHVLLTWLNSKVVPLKGISVGNDSVKLGSQKKPGIIYTPANATNKAYEMLSTDTNTLTIDGDAYIGKALGNATVVVRAFDGNFSKQINVKVIPVAVDSISGNDSAGAIGDTVVPKVNFFPANSTYQTYSIALLKASAIIKLDTARKAVIGMAIGKDTVEVTSTDGSKKARLAFTVGPVLPRILSVPDTNGTGSDLVTPRLIWTPATTTNKAYTLSIPPADTLVAAVRAGQVLCKSVGVVAAVTITSTADATVKATFKFTVGAVAVTSISVNPSVVAWNSVFSPAVTIFPANASNKLYSISVSPADAGKLTVQNSTTLYGLHLVTTNVVIKALGDTTKTVNWPVTVVRTPFKGPVYNLIYARCTECHNSTSALPNWTDSATVVYSNPGTSETNPQKIIRRINAPNIPMPPVIAKTPGPLNAADIKILTDWLSEN